MNRKHGLHLSMSYAPLISSARLITTSEDYHDLQKYSITDYTFWQDLWEYLGIIYSVAPDKVRIFA